MQGQGEQDGQVAAQVEHFLMQYAAEYNEAHLVLAMHAAFPPVITTDLLYQLWANFKAYKGLDGQDKTIPIWAVSDVLIGSFYRQTGLDLYELDQDIRAYLINELREDDRFGDRRIVELAAFLYQYALAHSQAPEWKNFNEVQQWTAYMAVEPGKAAIAVVNALREMLQEGESYATIGIVNLIGELLRQGGDAGELLGRQLKALIVERHDGIARPLEIKLPVYLRDRLVNLIGLKAQEKPRQDSRGSRIHAVLIGARSRVNRVGAPFLKEEDEAVTRMARALQPPNGLPMGDVWTEHNCTAKKMQATLSNALSQTAEGDVLFIYFAGDVIDGKIDHYLVMSDYSREGNVGVVERSDLQAWLRPHNQRLTIIFVLDTITDLRDWLYEGERNIQISYQDNSGTRQPHRHIFPEIVEKVLEPPTSGLMTYRQLFQTMYRQTPDLAPRNLPTFYMPDQAWDSYIFRPIESGDDTRREMLRDLGYPLPAERGQNAGLSSTLNEFARDLGLQDAEKAMHYLRLTHTLRHQSELKVAVIGNNSSAGLISFFTLPGKMSCKLTDLAKIELRLDGPRFDLLLDADIVIIDLRTWPGTLLGLEPKSSPLPNDFLYSLVSLVPPLDKELLMILANQKHLDRLLFPELMAAGIYLIQLPNARLQSTSMGQVDPSVSQHPELTEYRNLLLKLPAFRRPDHWLKDAIQEARETKRLILRNRSLQSIPAEIFDLADLEYLDLTDNPLHELPHNIDELSALEYLSLRNCPIHILPPAVARLPKLKEIDIEGCPMLNLPLDIAESLGGSTEAFRDYAARHWQPQADGKTAFIFLCTEEEFPMTLSAEIEKLITRNKKGFSFYWHTVVRNLPQIYALLQAQAGPRTFVYIIDDSHLLVNLFSTLETFPGSSITSLSQRPETALTQFFRGIETDGHIHLLWQGMLFDQTLNSLLYNADCISSIICWQDDRTSSKVFALAFFRVLFAGESISAAFSIARDLISNKIHDALNYTLSKGHSPDDEPILEAIDPPRWKRRLPQLIRKAIDNAKHTGELDLSDLGLLEWPEDIFKLTKLRKLNVSGNELTGISRYIYRLSSLEEFICRNNPMILPSPVLTRLRKLKVLDISGCPAIRLPRHIGELKQLTVLDISGTNINVLPASMVNLKELKKLTLPDKQFLNIDPDLQKPNKPMKVQKLLASLRPIEQHDPEFGKSYPYVLSVLSGKQTSQYRRSDKRLSDACGLNYFYHSLKECNSLIELAAYIRVIHTPYHLLIITDSELRLLNSFGKGRYADILILDYFASFGLKLNLVYIGPLTNRLMFRRMTHGLINLLVIGESEQTNDLEPLLDLLLDKKISFGSALDKLRQNSSLDNRPWSTLNSPDMDFYLVPPPAKKKTAPKKKR